MSKQHVSEGVEVIAALKPGFAKILSLDALSFLAKLHRRFNPKRLELLEKRSVRQKELDKGKMPDFLPETKAIRDDSTWQVAPIPPDLQNRKVEITGPTERKMMINAFNSGADIFMADFEDSLSPTWDNVVQGQINLTDAIRKTLEFTGPEGKKYSLKDKTALLLVRPRGWHLNEKHLLIDDEPISASLFDFGLFFFHNAKQLIQKGTAPYFYLPKIESHLEARLWNDVFNFAQDELSIPRSSIRATVLIETILAAFEMDEILYELRSHAAGLNAGRWDYIFSIIKKFSQRHNFIFPDRGQITMTVPFMRAYTELLIQTCHKRKAHALGGMAAFIPSRKDPHINEVALNKVRDDKVRESADGFDGTWVAHPDLVPIAMEVFTQALDKKPHQKHRLREDVHVTAKELLNFQIPNGQITKAGFHQNINVALQYLDSWLRGVGAAAIANLMEDAATAEISRAQLWQWLHNPDARLDGKDKITADLYRHAADEEQKKIEADVPGAHKLAQARRLLDRLVSPDGFIDFLTLEAYLELP